MTQSPLAGCHHQKVLVIDDKIAFCGGGDFGVDRWDTPAHPDRDARRIDPTYATHPPRHEVAMMVDGEAARALGDLARERWRRASGEAAPAPEPSDGDPWPAGVQPRHRRYAVAIARTEPAWRGRPAVQEWKRLTLAAIAAARRTIYLENQYFTSPTIAEALARRLAEPEGPEIVLVSTEAQPELVRPADHGPDARRGAPPAACWPTSSAGSAPSAPRPRTASRSSCTPSSASPTTGCSASAPPT